MHTVLPQQLAYPVIRIGLVLKEQFLSYGSVAPVFGVSITPGFHLIWRDVGGRCAPGTNYKVSANISLEFGEMDVT